MKKLRNKIFLSALSVCIFAGVALFAACTEEASASQACQHKWNGGAVVKASTCITAGEKAYTCVECGEQKIEKLPLGEHVETKTQKVEPTCTNAGLSEGVSCAVCSAVLVEPLKIPATGHTEVRLGTTSATCEEDGFSGGMKCLNCNYIVSGEILPATGHTWDEGAAISNSTCTVNGTIKYTCLNCGETENREAPLKEHYFTNGTCRDCGSFGELVNASAYATVQGLNGGSATVRLQLWSGGGCTMDNFSATTDTAFDLSVIDGYYLLGLNTHAFSWGNADNVKSLSFGEHVQYVADRCFQQLSALESVNFKGAGADIGSYAFYRCEKLQSVTFSGELLGSGMEYSVGEYAFYGCNGLTIAEIPQGTVRIGQYAFNNCFKLGAISLPNSVVSVGKKAFANCAAATTVTLGKNLQTIGEDAFVGLLNAKTIFNHSSLKVVAGSSTNGGVARYAVYVYGSI